MRVMAVHGYDGLVLATFMAGIILGVAGCAGGGRVIHYIPHPVITGFAAGIAVIIASSQASDFLGLGIERLPAGVRRDLLRTLKPLLEEHEAKPRYARDNEAALRLAGRLHG